MSKEKPFNIWTYLLSRQARLTIIVPLILYNLAFWWLGAGAALIITACYSAGLELICKKTGSLAIIALILVSGSIHYLYLRGYHLFGIEQEGVLLSIGGSLSVIIVFGIYSLLGRPVIRTQAENAMPRLTELPVYGTSTYSAVWQEISLIWIITYALKALVLIHLSEASPANINGYVFLGAWPLTLVMIAFSIYWPRFRWSAKRQA